MKSSLRYVHFTEEWEGGKDFVGCRTSRAIRVKAPLRSSTLSLHTWVFFSNDSSCSWLFILTPRVCMFYWNVGILHTRHQIHLKYPVNTLNSIPDDNGVHSPITTTTTPHNNITPTIGDTATSGIDLYHLLQRVGWVSGCVPFVYRVCVCGDLNRANQTRRRMLFRNQFLSLTHNIYMDCFQPLSLSLCV